MVLGAELCPWRLPALEVLEEAAQRCRSFDRSLALTTPVIREGSFDRVWEWLLGAVERAPGAEVSFNDWGLWERARREALDLTPVAGRLLSRQQRGPRVLAMIPEVTVEEARALRGSVWSDPAVCEQILELGAVRAEMDLLLQGTDRPRLPDGLGLTVHAPWLPVTLSPSCPWTGSPLGCDRPCLAHPPVRLENGEAPVPLWSAGNALFVRFPYEPAPRVIAGLGADRVVWAGGIPG